MQLPYPFFLADFPRPPQWRQGLFGSAALSTAIVAILGAFVLFQARRLTSVRSRLLVAAPVVTAFILVPFLFDSETETFGVLASGAIMTWWSAFKAVGWSQRLGPLYRVEKDKGNFLAFALVLLLPLAYQGSSKSTRSGSRDNDKQKGARFAASPFTLRLRPAARFASLAIIKGVPAFFLVRFLLSLGGVSDDINIHATFPSGTVRLVLPLWQRHVLYATAVYLVASILMDLAATLVWTWLALLAPSQPLVYMLRDHFDAPFLSAHLRHFWGKDWNQAASGLLRELVFEPLNHFLTRRQHSTMQGKEEAKQSRETRLVTKGRGRSRSPTARKKSKINASLPVAQPAVFPLALAQFGAFLVSGIMHELLLWFANRGVVTFHWFWFFTAQGVLTAFEGLVDLAVAKHGSAGLRRVATSWLLRWPLTLFLLFVTAELFFWPPVERAGLDMRAMRTLMEGLREAASGLTRT